MLLSFVDSFPKTLRRITKATLLLATLALLWFLMPFIYSAAPWLTTWDFSEPQDFTPVYIYGGIAALYVLLSYLIAPIIPKPDPADRRTPARKGKRRRKTVSLDEMIFQKKA